jgi:competence protein ComGC
MTPKNVNRALKLLLAFMVVGVITGLFFANKTLTTIATDTAKQKAEIDVTQKQIDAYSLTKIKVESLDYVNELAQKVFLLKRTSRH